MTALRRLLRPWPLRPSWPQGIRSLLLGLALAGCASVPEASAPRTNMPFHVAVIPIDSRILPEEGSDVSKVRLGLEPEAMSQALVGELTDGHFTSVTLLEHPEHEAESTVSWTPERWDKFWIKSAAAAKADLLLECKLDYSRQVSSRRNSKVWLTLPLFVTFFPFSYAVNDRSYTTVARLTIRLHDLNPIYFGRSTLSGGGGTLTQLESRSGEATMDFIDRAGSHVRSYLPSVLIPPSFLNGRISRVESELEALVSADLMSGISAVITEASREIVVAPHVAPFYLETGARVIRAGRNLNLLGEVVLEKGDAQSMGEARVQVGNETYLARFADGIRDEELSSPEKTFLRYPIHLRLPAPRPVDSIILELTDGRETPVVRSFTIPVTQDPSLAR